MRRRSSPFGQDEEPAPKYYYAALVFGVLFGLTAIYAWEQHDRVQMLCKWTGVHLKVRQEDAETARQGVDSICSGMVDVTDEQPAP